MTAKRPFSRSLVSRSLASNPRTIGTCVALLLAGVAGQAHAANSSPSELRGYGACLAKLEAQRPVGLATPRHYYLAKHADANTYYVNTTQWENGVRTARRMNCTTSRNGREVLQFSTSDGRYALNTGNTLIVAER